MKKMVCNIVIFVLIFQLLCQRGLYKTYAMDSFNMNLNYIEVINNYFDAIANDDSEMILELYGPQLYSFVQAFFDNEDNQSNHFGVYNVIDCEVERIIQKEYVEQIIMDDTIYEDCFTFLVESSMSVYESDKYYKDGLNYFLISVGNNIYGELKIYNIEIPDYRVIKSFIGQNEADDYYRERNGYLYSSGSEVALMSTDRPVYVDRVQNPTKIRLYYNGAILEPDFDEYLSGTVAAECNSGLYGGQSGYDACAMACKMYAIHKWLTAASGANYDIIAPTHQAYTESPVLSTEAQNAINNIYNYFVLDEYGAVFPTFYRTRISDSSYCTQYGGILPQKEAGYVSSNWRDIMRYYYTRVSYVNYYNSQMNMGGLTITDAHTHDWSEGPYCWYCYASA